MKTLIFGTTAAIGLTIGATIATAQTVVVSPQEESEVTTYVTKEHWSSVNVPATDIVVGHELPSTVELRTVPKVKYKVAVVNGETVLVDPGSRKIVKIIKK